MHKHTACRQRRACSRGSLGLAPQSPGGSVITHVPPPRQPPAGLHSALLVLNCPDTPVARGLPVEAAASPPPLWRLLIGSVLGLGSPLGQPWLIPSSHLSQERRCCPLCLGLSWPLNRTCLATWDGPCQRAPLMVVPSHSLSERADIAQQTGLALGRAFAQEVGVLQGCEEGPQPKYLCVACDSS